VVIAGCVDAQAVALAASLVKTGATVILAGGDAQELEKAADQSGGFAMPFGIRTRDGLKRLMDSVYCRWGNIGCWIFHWVGDCGADPWTSMPATDDCWHERVLLQMFLSMHLVGRMCQAGAGRIVTAAPWSGLYAPFTQKDYFLDKHAALHFGQRLAGIGRKAGIGVSIRCIGTPMPENLTDKRVRVALLRSRAAFTVACLRRGQFLIDDSGVLAGAMGTGCQPAPTSFSNGSAGFSAGRIMSRNA